MAASMGAKLDDEQGGWARALNAALWAAQRAAGGRGGAVAELMPQAGVRLTVLNASRFQPRDDFLGPALRSAQELDADAILVGTQTSTAPRPLGRMHERRMDTGVRLIRRGPLHPPHISRMTCVRKRRRLREIRGCSRAQARAGCHGRS